MSLYKRGDIWWSRIEVNKQVYQFSTRMTDKNKARTVEANFRIEKAKGIVGLSLPTLSEYGTQFINSLPGRVSKQTFTYYVEKWLVLEKSELGETRIDKIDAAAIERFVQWRRKQRVGVVTVNHNLRVLRRALRLAVEWGLLTKIPKVRLLPNEPQREYVIPEEAVKKFETTQFEPRYALMSKLVPFLVDTGLRRREACNLEWQNVSAKDVHVTKGKTKFSRRRVPLTDRAKRILAELPQDGRHVFKVNGHAMTPSWASHSFLAVRRLLGLPNECVLHSTRHTFCSRLGEAGCDAFAIQRLAGHSSITISQRYVHPSIAKLDEAIARLND